MNDDQIRILLETVDRLDAMCTDLRSGKCRLDHRWRFELQGILLDLHLLISEIQDAYGPTHR